MSEINQQPKSVKPKMPKIRFEGFSESWVNKVISEFIQLRSETDNQDKYSIDVELENLVSNKGILIGDLTVRTQTNSIFRKGDILFGRLRPYLNKWWLADQDGVKSGEIWALYPKDQFVNTFIYACVQDQKFLNFVNQTSGTKMPRANWSSVQKESLSISLDYKEQTQIGNLFQELDKLIELQTRTVELAETHKKSMLQKMFPQKGEKTPKVRFEGFSGDWELYNLNDLVKINMGQSPDSENYTDNPEDKILVQGNADLYRGKVIPRIYTTQITKVAEKGDIILTVRAPVGAIAITDFDVVLGRGVAAIKGNRFIYYTLELFNLIGSWLRFSSGSTFDSVNSNEIKQMPVMAPDNEEQIKIGNYFKELDRNIESEKQKLEQYQTMKRAMLQRMFV
ncbi:restriction endonuclease subunit S [Ignatzschineria sp. LJL83]